MFYIIIALSIFVLDYVLKKYIESNKQYGQEEKILNGHIIINKYHNKGGMLNLLEKKPNIIVSISGVLFGMLLLVFGLIIRRRGNILLKLGMALTIGGAASNLYDRLAKGYVVDYFSFKKIKNVVFNISDISIFIGTFLIALVSTFKRK
ncbi:signal peptidase II [Anaeromicropila herbilytica]|uniref:Lipoprotein signal peptidase n=1 Tax=Anaeromicropila herbilytica TaxID=2785025 RepID=A0A7R7IEW3_9FIRM|nr:signal peptidase II [Anaeromicropila herbilytica]BCN32539.1 lipoprotein signal peptidase [Anaeromicropila herbilytica]